ncbi:MAG: hypothetical protein ACXVVK_03655 [Solirubrobacteraceae bacterium]
MPVDLAAAEQFMFSTARVLERHCLAALLHGAPAEPVRRALVAYRNPDGGFGNALEPDVRAPHSEPVATLNALEVLASLQASGDPLIAEAAAWIDTIADADGGVPFVLPDAAAYPRAPWMVPSDGGSHLTFALAAVLWELGAPGPWRDRATEWCWAKLARPDELSAYWVKFGLAFLDHVDDAQRAEATVESLRPRLGPDGSLPVPGGAENERLTPVTLSPRPDGRSRRLFTAGQIEADLDRLESGQQDDGGWTFDWLAWTPAQAAEWRGLVTLRALSQLLSDRRL